MLDISVLDKPMADMTLTETRPTLTVNRVSGIEYETKCKPADCSN